MPALWKTERKKEWEKGENTTLQVPRLWQTISKQKKAAEVVREDLERARLAKTNYRRSHSKI